MKHECVMCNFITSSLPKYLLHLETNKHIQNKLNLDRIKQETIIQTREETLEVVKEVVIPAIKKEVKNNNKEILNEVRQVNMKVDKVTKIATQNKQYAKSTLTILNEKYRDNPPLEYQGDRESLTALHEYYGLTVDEALNTNKLQKAIIKDYKNKLLVDSIIKILTQFLKKDNLHLQSIFNTDSARNNYTAKHQDAWKSDKKGIHLNGTIIKPFCLIIKILMENYRKYKSDKNKYRRYQLFHKDDDPEDIFMEKNEPDFVNKDDSSDENRKGIDDLEEICNINTLIKHIQSNRLYDEIIYKLSPILSYNVRIKNVKKVDIKN